MKEYTSFRISKESKATLEELSEKHNASQIKIAEAMIEYFKKTDFSPFNYKVLSPAEEIKKLRDTIIGFFRTQEKEYIIPVFGQVSAMLEEFFRVLPELKDKNNTRSNDTEKDKAKISAKQELSKQDKQELDNRINKLKLENIKLKDYLKLLLEDIEKSKFTGKQILKTPTQKINEISQYVYENK